MGIVNAGQITLYDDIEPELRELSEDVILNRRPDATDRLLEVAGQYKGDGGQAEERILRGAKQPVEERLKHALVHGIDEFIEADTEAARKRRQQADRGDRGSADGRHERGRRPVRGGQDVPAAGGQVGARDEAGGRHLDPSWRRRRRPRGRPEAGAGKVVMATVKGDVHDIGKNIVGVVLQCNNYQVVDLGVMVPAQKILETAGERRPT